MKFAKKLFSNTFKELTLNCDNIAKWELESSKNVIITEDGISTRPGMSLSDAPIIFSPSDFSVSPPDLKLTDFFINLNGHKAQLAVAIESDYVSNVYYRIYAIFSDCTKENLGTITFTRTDIETFGTPDSYVIYSGKPTIGGGIYFLSRIVYRNGQPDDYRIYEISNDFTEWMLVSKSNFYIPTVLAFGRGDQVSFAIESNDIRLSSVKKLESLNMLRPSYISYYTTDGFSYSFTLPDADIGNYSIHAKLQCENGKAFEWTVSADATVSDFLSVSGTLTRLCLDRNANRFYFETDTGVGYHFPFYGTENNLCVTVSGNLNDDPLNVSSMQHICNIVGKNGRSISFFYGNRYSPDDICWIDPESPLYFPKSCSVNTAFLSGSVSRIIDADNGLLIFKNQTVISADITSSEKYDLDAIINGVADSKNLTFPSLSIKKKLTLPAEIIGESVNLSMSDVCFCCQNKKSYRLSSSLAIKDSIASIPTPSNLWATYDDKYLIFNNNKCSVIEADKTVLCWEFPVCPVAASDFGDKTVFFVRTDYGNIYGFTLEGENDTFLSDESQTSISASINSSVRILLCDEGAKAKLRALSILLDSEKDFVLKIFDGKDEIYEKVHNGESFTLHNPVCFKRLFAEFIFSGSASLKKVTLRFSKFSKL